MKSGDAAIFGRLEEELDAIAQYGISYAIVPGITAAAGAVATMGRSFTQRDRNSGVKFLTGHDVLGFADHDWRALARSGEVAAIYMGKRASRFIQGRLIMFGADPATPMTLVENVSRPDQRIIATTLGDLATETETLSGPAVMLLGLTPRTAAGTIKTLKEGIA